MTQNERELFNHGTGGGDYTPDDWLNLVSGWQNDDGSITIILNAQLRTGQRIRLFKKHPNAPEGAPDFQCNVKRKSTSKEDGLIEILVEKKDMEVSSIIL